MRHTPDKKTSAKAASAPNAERVGLFSCCVKAPVEEDVIELDFAHCSLNEVPNDIFAYERTLERLQLECNSIRNLPRQLFQCHELKVLNLSDNEITQIPDALCSLSQVTELYLNKNNLTEIPDTIKQLKHLCVLDVSTNPLQKVPEGCTQLVSITELYLNDTFLDFLPANFGRLVKLRILELRENAIATLPKSLCRLTSLRRLDLGNNDLGEVPEVVGSLIELGELWLDGNRIRELPPSMRNLTALTHLEMTCNLLEHIPETIGECKSLELLALTSNDLVSLPESIGDLCNLVTLKVDDNKLESLPNSIGKLENLEELVVSLNYLTSLPPSIGLCRKLHTLNLDDNDVEYLPQEIGSCIRLKILSAQGNRLTTLPAELDHITQLAVINVTGNKVQNLPVSLMKLRNISALWLSGNQTKPLIQLNQDVDPETGQRVLTNFLLPQIDSEEEAEPLEASRKGENVTEKDSFQPALWDAERERKTMIKWAGDDENLSAKGDTKEGKTLRREPTPFPKEMRAMAKRVQSLRSGKQNSPTPTSGTVLKTNETTVHKKKKKQRTKDMHLDRPDNFLPDPESIQIKEAKVSKPSAEMAVLPGTHSKEDLFKDQIELQQFEELERSLNIDIPPKSNAKLRKTPSGNSQIREHEGTTRKPSDPLPKAPERNDISSQNNSTLRIRPPPYHIAAAFSKHARDFDALHSNTKTKNNQNQNGSESSQLHERGPSDSNSISEQSEASTAQSSLQTVLKSPLTTPQQDTASVARFKIANVKRNPKSDDLGDEVDVHHASQLRRVSEQLLSNPRTRQSVTGVPSLSSSRPGSFAGPSRRPSSQIGFNSSSESRSETTSVQSNGLLSTIEQAAHSDDEIQPQDQEVSYPQPNYENLDTNRQNRPRVVQKVIPIASTSSSSPGNSSSSNNAEEHLSTAHFVINKKVSQSSVVETRLPKFVGSPRN